MSLRLWGLVLFMSAFSLHAQETPISAPTNAQVQFTANLSNIQFGKPFKVSYTMPPTIKQIITIDSNITALGETDIKVDNVTPTTLDLSVTSFAVQNYPMPSLLITALDDQQHTNQFYTPSFMIPISNDIVSNTNISMADIEPIYFVWDPLWTILIVGLLLIILAIFLFSRVKTTKVKTEPIIQIDPFDQARKKLNALKAQSAELNEDTYKEFFVELSETVREFMSATVMPMSLELPTSELIQSLKKQKIDQDVLDGIMFILKNSDRAKYAKQIFPQERINEVLAESFRLVKVLKNQQGDENEL